MVLRTFNADNYGELDSREIVCRAQSVFTFFCFGIFRNNLTLFPGANLVTRIFHQLDETPSEFVDTL